MTADIELTNRNHEDIAFSNRSTPHIRLTGVSRVGIVKSLSDSRV